jgi:hypothetical protein
MSRTLSLGVGIFLLTCLSHAFDVTQCGQIVPAGEIGVLQGDLTCAKSTLSGFCAKSCLSPGFVCDPQADKPCTTVGDCSAPYNECAKIALVLERRATLELGGFSIAGVVGDEPHFGVFSRYACEVHGPGEIAHFVIGAALTRAIATDLVVHDNTFGIVGNLRLTDVTATANDYGIQGVLRVDGGVVANGNVNNGVLATRVRGQGLTANDNGSHGVSVSPRPFTLTGFTATGNGGAGILSFRGGVLIDSLLVGNNGGGIGVDVGTERRPRLLGTTCGKSSQTFNLGFTWGPPWGVCAND